MPGTMGETNARCRWTLNESGSIWDDGENQRDVQRDDLVPFFISPKARTAMRTLSSWSSREFEPDDAEDGEGDGLGIVGGRDCREGERTVGSTCSHDPLSRVNLVHGVLP